MMGKLILPWKLSGVATFEWVSMAAGFFLVLVIALLWLFSKEIDHKTAFLGAAWYLLFMVPPLFHRLELAADHFDYLEHRAHLPMFGFLLLLHALLVRFGKAFKKRTVVTLAVVVLAVLAGRTILYSRTFSGLMVFWNAAIESNPFRSNFHSVMGKLYHENKDHARAKQAFLKAIELSRLEDPYNYKNLAVIYKELGEIDEALPMYEKAFELAPDNPDIAYALGRAYYEAKRFEKAEKALLTTAALVPGHADAYIHLIGVYASQGRIDEAIDACQEIIKFHPDHFHAHNILADLYAREGKMDLAVEMWRRITRIKPDHLPAYEHLMQYYLDRNDLDQARFYALELLRRGGRISSAIRAKLGLP
jgi:pentatricopeptide repeat protein